MTVLCVIRTCPYRNDSKITSHGIMRHRFPTCEHMKQKWVAFVNAANRTTDFVASISHRLCSKHFDEDAYLISKNNIRAIRKNAVPKYSYRFTAVTAVRFNLMPPHGCLEMLEEINKFDSNLVILRDPLELYPEDTKEACNTPPVYRVLVKDPLAISSTDISEDRHGTRTIPDNGHNVTDHSSRSPVKSTNPRVASMVETLQDSDSSDSVESNDRAAAGAPPPRLKRTAYPGDLTPADFATPELCDMSLGIITRYITDSRRRLKLTQRKLRRANKKIEEMKKTIGLLKKKKPVSKEAGSMTAVIRKEFPSEFDGNHFLAKAEDMEDVV